jgi:anthranilate phosphoribosyltransferase
VLEYNQGICTEWVIKPEDYGLKHASLNTVCVQSPKESLALIQSALAGDKGAARDLIVLNAAAAIYCAKDALSYANAIEIAKDSIDNGKALKCFEQTRLLTQTLDKENHHD